MFKNLLLNIEFASSGGDFKRNLSNKAYRINNVIETNDTKLLTLTDAIDKQIKISFGKKKHFVIKVI